MRSPHRDAIRTARSLVVKVGTTALTTESGMFDAGRLADLADAIEARMKAGTDVVIVSSGPSPPVSSHSGWRVGQRIWRPSRRRPALGRSRW